MVLFPLIAWGRTDASAQNIAVTPRGDTVVLEDNGQWFFIENWRNRPEVIKVGIDTLEERFATPAHATTVLKHFDGHYQLYYDETSTNKLDPNDFSPLAQHMLASKDQAVMMMTIVERGSLQAHDYFDAVMVTTKTQLDSYEILERDYRIVNDRTTFHVRMKASVKGLDLMYHYYIQSRDAHMVQFVGWSLDTGAADEARVLGMLNGVD